MNGPPNGLSAWARLFRDLGSGVASILLYYVLARAPSREDITAVRTALSENLSGLQALQVKTIDNQARIIELLKESKR